MTLLSFRKFSIGISLYLFLAQSIIVFQQISLRAILIFPRILLITSLHLRIVDLVILHSFAMSSNISRVLWMLIMLVFRKWLVRLPKSWRYELIHLSTTFYFWLTDIHERINLPLLHHWFWSLLKTFQRSESWFECWLLWTTCIQVNSPRLLKIYMVHQSINDFWTWVKLQHSFEIFISRSLALSCLKELVCRNAEQSFAWKLWNNLKLQSWKYRNLHIR